eukprot:TRINITY_DN2060_c0_g1_i10.p1 TRINITY_DN2060_c0_g1~~TRINITY_DN2060_c0_g1_i10.p1  ORF type:complete len:269 (+),score=42.01 TRINITY_DN2060_c0_g1_i10:335-1141(+)
MARISTAVELHTALEGAVYVQVRESYLSPQLKKECVPEVLNLKIEVFTQLDRIAPSNIILASSTSAIPPSKFTEFLTTRNRCLVAHPINPPHLIPLVEIVPSPWTDDEVVSRAVKILKDVGQKPVVMKKEVNGFIANRLQYALLAECFRLVEDGIVSPADIDTSIVHGLAPRWAFMGPFQTIDLNAPNGIRDYCDRYLNTISTLVKQQDNNREFGQGLVQQLHEHQRSLYNESQISQAIEWRDTRLMSLCRHQLECQTIDQEMFPSDH